MSKSPHLEGDKLVSCLKELMVSCEPSIRDAGTVEQAEELMLHLEENDENFHKYEFVKALRACLDEELGALVDEEIEMQALSQDGSEDLVDKITDKIINSKEYSHLSRTLKNNVNRALERLLTNYAEEFGARRANVQSSNNETEAQRSFSISDIDSSLSGSFNQVGFMFMNQEQLLMLTDNLDKKCTSEVRTQALCSLIQVAAIDVQSEEYWASLRKGLLDCLADSNENITNLAMRFVAKGFSSSSPNSTQMYTTMAEHLESLFTSKRASIPKIRSGFDVKKPEYCRLLKSFRLMNEYQNTIPQYWVRYSEKFVKDVVDKTLSLLSVSYKLPIEDSKLTPMHFISLLDAKSSWFIKWMHGNYSRNHVLCLLQKYKLVLVESVKSCLRYIEHANTEVVNDSEIPARNQTNDSDGNFTPAQLDYLHFVHSFNMIGRLICYVNGRNLFPLAIRDKEDGLDPGTLITETIKRICTLESVCASVICKEEIIRELMNPFEVLIKRKSINENKEFVYLQLADIVSSIASHSFGRRALLLRSTPKSKSPAEIMTELVQRSLSDNYRISKSVMVAMVYICRQFYNTAEGVDHLSEFNLHQVLARAWKQALDDSERAATPTEGKHPTDKETISPLYWEEILRDNLLNFAGSPRGILLLELSGAIVECTAYMFTRFIKKLQVSKCEKFGYGLMLTQLAATAPGMSALLSTRFLPTLIEDAWSAIETPPEDDWPVVQNPKHWPVEAIDKSALKPLTNLLNLLSAYPAVYELIGGEELPNKDNYSLRETPNSIIELLDRIMMVNSDAKIRSLFNYEQSHLFGLRILSVLVSSLDTFLLLQTQYGFQEMLLSSQRENVLENKPDDIIIDALSVERNYILVKSFLIGGPSERILPSRSIQNDVSTPYSYPMIREFPIPRVFLPAPAKPVTKGDTPLSNFLADHESKPGSLWLEAARKAFIQTVRKQSADQMKLADCCLLIERTGQVLSTLTDRLKIPINKPNINTSMVNSFQLTDLDKLGVEMTVRYGERLRILNQNNCKENLVQLIKSCRVLMTSQTKPVKSELKYLNGAYKGFDWFAATMFLLFNGGYDRCWNFLETIYSTPEAIYLWPHRIHQSCLISTPIRSSGIHPLFYKTCHQVELLLSKELPSLHSAFRMAGYPSSQIVQDWLSQIFWNRLDWPVIVQILALILVSGVDYQVYVCLAILKHLAPEIRQQMQNNNLVMFLKEEAIHNFKLRDHLSYMQSLEENYRDLVLSDLLNINQL